MKGIFIVLLIVIIFIYLIYHVKQNNIYIDSDGKLKHVSYISNKQFDVKVINNLLTKEECEQLIELAKKQNMFESQVVSDKSLSEYNADSRKSYQCWIDANYNPILKKISDKSAELTGYPYENQEMVQVVKYEEGGKFDAHYDPCVQNDKICSEMNRGAGQRRSTLLIYLNDKMEGGETEFVIINKKIKPEIGKAILFYSSDDFEQIIKESKHRGCPVKKGEKWIATIWSHAYRYKN